MTGLENALINTVGIISFLIIAFIWFLKLALGILLVVIIWSILEDLIGIIKRIIRGK